MGARGSIFDPQIGNCIGGKKQRDEGQGDDFRSPNRQLYRGRRAEGLEARESIFEVQIGNCIGGEEQRDGGQGFDFRAPNRQLYKGKGAEGWGPGGRFSSPKSATV